MDCEDEAEEIEPDFDWSPSLDDDEYSKEQSEPPNKPDGSDGSPSRKRTWCYFDEYLDLPDRQYWDDNGEHGFLINLPGGSIMLLTGRWGSHKTNVISKMVLDAVLDKGARALYIACEGQYLYGRERMPEFCRSRGISVRDLRGRFHFGDEVGQGEDPLGVAHVQALDHPTVDRDDAFARGLSLLVGRDDLGRVG